MDSRPTEGAILGKSGDTSVRGWDESGMERRRGEGRVASQRWSVIHVRLGSAAISISGSEGPSPIIDWEIVVGLASR
jgi:hypothetical protein